MESCTADKGQPTESELHLHTEDYAHLRNSHGTIAVKIKYTKNYQTTPPAATTTTLTHNRPRWPTISTTK